MNKAVRSTVFLIVPVIGLLLANCAGTPETNPVRQVQNEYDEIKEDSLIVTNAPEALKKAREAISDLRKSIASDESRATIEEQTLVAMQRVEIAQKTAELRVARTKVQRTSDELKILLDDIREAELKEMEAEERARYLTNFRVQQTRRGIVLSFRNINFDQEKAYLKSSAERSINELADFLDAYPQRKMLIEGHTDDTGASSFNRKLSQERANAVREALISRNIDEARIEAVGLGEQYPVASNKYEPGRQQNRRVEVIISDKSGTIPDRQ